MNARMTLALAAVATLGMAGCGSVVEHRHFVPDMPGVAAVTPGEGILGARHVVPPNAVDDRSVVLVYCTGARLLETWGTSRSAELIMKFRVRNDEPVALVIDPQRVLLVLGTSPPLELSPDWIQVDDEEYYDPDGRIVVMPRSTASWQLEFVLPGSSDPLGDLGAFVLSWTYRLGRKAFAERTRFVPRGKDYKWTASTLETVSTAH